MPFVRVSRDKRGYETIYLVHTAQRRGRSGATRVLYVFRTPPGVKVGRDPFDAELRRTLEAQHPGVEFDWTKLSDIPPPPPDVEHWRERRRAEKAARLARKAEEADESLAEGDEADSPEGRPEVEERTPGGSELPDAVVSPGAGTVSDAPSAAAAKAPAEGTPGARSGRRRRRRRGGRNRVEPGAPAPEPPGPADSPGPSPEREDAGGDGEDVA